MLTIIVPEQEYYNEKDSTFENVGSFILHLEHSLISLSKWESKHQKPFLSSTEKNSDEIFSYIQSMVLDDEYPADVFSRLSRENIKDINDYIESKESATIISSLAKARGRAEIITSELIYYWMVAFNIPFECETWHLNRLFNLIQICGIKNAKPQTMSRTETAARNRELNAQRRKKYNTSG